MNSARSEDADRTRSRAASAVPLLAAAAALLAGLALPASASGSFPDRAPRNILQPGRGLSPATAPTTRTPAMTPAGRAASPTADTTSYYLFFLGSTFVEIDQRTKTLRVFLDEVFNASELYPTTTTYLEVWATPTPAYFGDGIPTGSVRLTYFDFPVLQKGERFLDAATAWTPYTPPADETWNVLLVLTEVPGAGKEYVDTDYRNNGYRVFGSSALMTKYGVSASVTFRNPYSGQSGRAYPSYLNDEFTFFDFGDPANPEVFVKVLAGNDPNWIQLLVGGTTDFEYTVSFAGCGRTLTFKKDAYTTGGYANGQAIPKSACPK